MGALLLITRVWLVFLAAFELPEIHGFLVGNSSLGAGFGSNLNDGAGEKRLWCAFLLCRVFARLAAAYDPLAPTTAAHNAAIHILELGYFGSEVFQYGCNGSSEILVVVGVNAMWFTALAVVAWQHASSSQSQDEGKVKSR